jgi:hypothetical protein
MENGRKPTAQADLSDTGSQLCAEFRRGCDDLKKTMRDMQTEMVEAFHSFARDIDAKLNEPEIADITLRQRLTAVESRLTEVEKRIHMPPQQTQ